MKALFPITLTRSLNEIHSGGFSKREELALGFKEGELSLSFDHIHELITLHGKTFSSHLNIYKTYLQKNPQYKEIEANIFIHENTKIHPSAVFDSSKGIIVIEEEVTVLPFSYLVGPLRIDTGATINPYANVRSSYIGKYSKIGGEISESVIESYTNKGHDGYVGNSYIGSWVNLAAGTSTSNLKNTYGEITMNGIQTHEQFLGSIIADHVKIAGNTFIYPGKIIGVNAHIYSTVTEDVPSFTNYISKDNLILLPLDIGIKIAERMYYRRNVPFTDDDKKMLSYAYTETEQSRKERNVLETKLSL